MAYKPTVGLEVHAELRTKLKMFCSCKNDPDERKPNVNICPICLGHPGALPVINKEAIRHILKVGLAVNGRLSDFSEFDRKNYFYPDIPKGYQISQYKFPLVSGGELVGVKLTKIHLEEDTARSIHTADPDHSLVDFNRAGVPLMELVTEPSIKSAQEAATFGRELQLLLQYLGAAAANMEKGEMRVEANVSVSSDSRLGTKTEIKNLNSFKSVEKAIEYEVKRQIKTLEDGKRVVQETRGWDEIKQETFSQREKEESHDYRYFPEPDLAGLYLSQAPEFKASELKKNLPETPNQKRKRYEQYGIKPESVEFFVYHTNLALFFEEVINALDDKKETQRAVNYIISDLASMGGKGAAIPEKFAKLIRMIADHKISSRGAKGILKVMFENGGDPEVIAQNKKLFQVSDAQKLESVVAEIIRNNPRPVSEYKSGNTNSIQFLIGQTMKATGGSGNPQTIKQILEKLLK